MYWMMTPISSICPSSMIVGEPPAFTSAMLLPATSVVTLSAKVPASVRQARAATVSNPDGAGASSRRFRKAIEDGLSIGTWGVGEAIQGANGIHGRHAKEARGRARRILPLRRCATNVSILHVTPLPRDRPRRRSPLGIVRHRRRDHHRARADAARADA